MFPGAAEHAIAVRPIDRFAARWQALPTRARQIPRRRLAVVGGGAGGVELALAAQHRLTELKGDAVEVALVTRAALLPSHNARVPRLFERILADRRVTVLTGSAVVRVAPRVRRPEPPNTKCKALLNSPSKWPTGKQTTSTASRCRTDHAIGSQHSLHSTGSARLRDGLLPPHDVFTAFKNPVTRGSTSSLRA